MDQMSKLQQQIAVRLSALPPKDRQRALDQMVGYLVAKVVDGYTAPQAKPTNTNT